MKLSIREKEGDKELFLSLRDTDTGKRLLDYLERLCAAVLDPETLTRDNVEARKDAIGIVKENLIERVRLVNDMKGPDSRDSFR